MPCLDYLAHRYGPTRDAALARRPTQEPHLSNKPAKQSSTLRRLPTKLKSSQGPQLSGLAIMRVVTPDPASLAHERGADRSFAFSGQGKSAGAIQGSAAPLTRIISRLVSLQIKAPSPSSQAVQIVRNCRDKLWSRLPVCSTA